MINEMETHNEGRKAPKVYFWQHLIQRITAMPWASRFMTNRLHRWDRWVYQRTRWRWTATEILAGLPVIFITTLGARTGIRRTTPLLAIRDGKNFILIATKFGAKQHPDWYFNLKTNPQVDVLYGGRTLTYLARELEGDERDASWAHAVAYYPGYQAYEHRAADRKIPVLILTPAQTAITLPGT